MFFQEAYQVTIMKLDEMPVIFHGFRFSIVHALCIIVLTHKIQTLFKEIKEMWDFILLSLAIGGEGCDATSRID